MNAEELFRSIASSTYTTADVHRRVRLIREYFEKKIFASQPELTLEAYLATGDVSGADRDALTSLGDEFYASFTKDSCYKLLDGIGVEAKKTPTVRLNVAFDIPPGEVTKIGLWFRENLPVNVLLDVKIDADAFGGCTFAWDGVFHDYSLRYLLARQKNEIVKILDSYGSKSV